MPTKKSVVPPEIYQLKVTLLGTSPPVWRRLLVPADLTLAQLHDVLQAAMGWEDGHMHEFSIGQRRFGRPDPEDQLMGMPSAENERTVRLPGILGRVGSKAIYTVSVRPTAALIGTEVRPNLLNRTYERGQCSGMGAVGVERVHCRSVSGRRTTVVPAIPGRQCLSLLRVSSVRV